MRLMNILTSDTSRSLRNFLPFMNHPDPSPTGRICRLQNIKSLLCLLFSINFEPFVIFRKNVRLWRDVKFRSKLPDHFRDVSPHKVFSAQVVWAGEMVDLLVRTGVSDCFDGRRACPEEIPVCSWGELESCLFHGVDHGVVYMGAWVDAKTEGESV